MRERKVSINNQNKVLLSGQGKNLNQRQWTLNAKAQRGESRRKGKYGF
jgi:hypothetical protein